MRRLTLIVARHHTSPSGKAWRVRDLPVSWTEHVDPKHMRLSPIEPDFQLELRREHDRPSSWARAFAAMVLAPATASIAWGST
jgi:hypothetical protein